MRQSRIRHARREFKRAFPQVADAVQTQNQRAARTFVRIALIRNAIIAVGVVGLLALRCATW